jgi:hypothetical protein
LTKIAPRGAFVVVAPLSLAVEQPPLRDHVGPSSKTEDV